MKKGFTIIELCAIILIIGILIAIALPKYQRFILRTKIANAAAFARSIGSAEERYKITNGSYTVSLPQLDIKYDECFAKPAYIEGNRSAKYVCDGFNYIVSRDTEAVNLDTNQPLEIFLLKLEVTSGHFSGMDIHFASDADWKMVGCGGAEDNKDIQSLCVQLAFPDVQ